MQKLNFFYQAEGLGDVGHLEVNADDTVSAVKRRLVEERGIPADCLAYLEDHDDPLGESAALTTLAVRGVIKVHLHRCRKIKVAVTFAATTVDHAFSPSTTIAAVKRWATKALEMSDDDASEHVLQISGSPDRPAPGTHLGSLAKHPHCRVAFDLVPNERVNGSAP